MSGTEPRPASWTERAGPRPASPTALLNLVIAQASFIAALMFYVGVIYTSAYYGHFHLSPFSLGLGFAEFVLQSLNLMTFPVLVGAVVLLVVVAVGGRWPRQAPPAGLARVTSLGTALAARSHLVVVVAGLLLLVLWWQWQLLLPYRWAGPLLVAVGLLLGEARRADADRPRGLRDAAVSVLAAAAFLLWTVTLAAAQLGERNARNDAREVVERTGLVVYSVQRLGIRSRSPELRFDDLGQGVHFRYRYTGLRLVVAREGRYYAVPVGWRAKTDHVYVIREADDVRVELTPGVR
ncbi:hypothetical protein [Streptomyces roseolilacinus]|uniref:Uncharacterized protein n=1 Tax=Streptomyces roseolilacinus TaxID=66904 RepID=A0A918EKZ2_9ACTN|nr:hypothetical protein [Streptomyces roseolilacinus]GGQ09318.1 hypothetical protein GCM10010249_29800 [Streptomyces roseolilacinus]